jgi:hypothetical protein
MIVNMMMAAGSEASELFDEAPSWAKLIAGNTIIRKAISVLKYFFMFGVNKCFDC